MRSHFPVRLFTVSLLVLGFVSNLRGPSQAVAQPSSPTSQPPIRIRSGGVRLFVPNVGQFDPRVRFQMRGAGGIWWFTDEGIWLTVLRYDQGRATECCETKDQGQWTADHRPWPDDRGSPSLVHRPSSGINLHLTFPGMSPSARLVAVDQQPARMNYFKGNDASKWRANVPTFGSLIWQSLYPDVDLAFGESWSVVQGPSSVVRLQIDGADYLQLDDSGTPLADTAIGPVALPALRTADDRPVKATIDRDTLSFSEWQPTIPPPTSNPSAVPSPQSSVLSPVDDPADLLYSTFLGGGGAG